MLSSVGIVSTEDETKSKILNVEFWKSVKWEIVSQSEACILANQKNTKVAHCLMDNLTRTSVLFKQIKSVNKLSLSVKFGVAYLDGVHDIYAPGHLRDGTFRCREGQLQQISVFAFSLNIKKHCKLE